LFFDCIKKNKFNEKIPTFSFFASFFSAESPHRANFWVGHPNGILRNKKYSPSRRTWGRNCICITVRKQKKINILRSRGKKHAFYPNKVQHLKKLHKRVQILRIGHFLVTRFIKYSFLKKVTEGGRAKSHHGIKLNHKINLCMQKQSRN